MFSRLFRLYWFTHRLGGMISLYLISKDLYLTLPLVDMYVKDTSIIITNSSPLAFRNNNNEVFKEINECFQGNLLSLNYDKTYFLQFVTKKNQ